MSTDFYILLVLFCLALAYCIEEHRWYRLKFDMLSEEVIYLRRYMDFKFSDYNKIIKGAFKDEVE